MREEFTMGELVLDNIIFSCLIPFLNCYVIFLLSLFSDFFQATKLKKIKTCLKDVVQQDLGTTQRRDTLNSIIADLDDMLCDTDDESEQ